MDQLLHRVRERIRPLVPRQLRVAANRAVFSGVGLALRGDAVRCPCCGHSYRRFARYPTEYCPACGSYERQRLLCLYLDRNPALVSGDVLHVGPERSIKNRYRPRARRWLAVDVDPDHPLADETMDVRSLALPDEAFDFVLCSHVLDIVEEHDQAVGELYRVTRPGGTVLIQAPWRSVKGMPDVYAQRLEGAGFRVKPELLEEQTGRDDTPTVRAPLGRSALHLQAVGRASSARRRAARPAAAAAFPIGPRSHDERARRTAREHLRRNTRMLSSPRTPTLGHASGPGGTALAPSSAAPA